MPAIVTCSCGKVLRGNEEQLYGLIREHVDRRYPEQHRRVSVTRDQGVEAVPADRGRLVAAPQRS